MVRTGTGVAIVLAAALAAGGATAAVTQEEAQQLKTSLTPVGAERAGNKDGSIPAWDGGWTQVPPGYKSGAPRSDPFAADKPLFAINRDNLAKYGDRLSEGVKAIFAKYPDFRIDVYQSRRTAAAPQWVYDGTARNAVEARTTNNGLKVEGAFAGIPFPIPHDGFEAMWNHLLAWQGVYTTVKFKTWVTTVDGGHVLSGLTTAYQQFPYYITKRAGEAFNGVYTESITVQHEPPYKSGEMLLVRDPVDQYGVGRQAWQYLTGQRRVRRAPAVAYDTPSALLSGVANYDEIFIFFGSLDRYNWKLVGKQELIVPYNDNKMLSATDAQLLGPHFLNPDLVRWELHRVWVVDASLAPGKRHIEPQRRFYLDEDTWRAVAAEGRDAQGQLWKVLLALPVTIPELPAVLPLPHLVFDLRSGVWVANNLFNETSPQYRFEDPLDENFFTPDSLAKLGVR